MVVHSLPLRKRVVCLSLLDAGERAEYRAKCWELGAFTSATLEDPMISHVLVPPCDKSGAEVCLSGLFVFYWFQIGAGVSEVVMGVHPEWLLECWKERRYVAETRFLVPLQTKVSTVSSSSNTNQRSSQSMVVAEKATLKKSSAAIAPRRSDASSIALRPDGVFKSIALSLFGWTDARMEASLSYQITANGGSIVELAREDQFACVCADGSRPTWRAVRMVSQRWVTDCIAQNELIDFEKKTFYTPSLSQLPLLMASSVCIYVTEKEEEKLEAIVELAKLCGIKVVSRNDSRTRLSLVTHFVFHDMVSLNRRRDLVPIALKACKSVVSVEWLKDTYLHGCKQEESKYSLNFSQLLPDSISSSPLSPFLSGISLIFSPSDDGSEQLESACSEAGATIVADLAHSCCSTQFRISRSVSCECLTLTQDWVRECLSQKRFIDKQSYIVRVDDNIDHLMAMKDSKVEIKWENKPAESLANSLKGYMLVEALTSILKAHQAAGTLSEQTPKMLRVELSSKLSVDVAQLEDSKQLIKTHILDFLAKQPTPTQLRSIAKMLGVPPSFWSGIDKDDALQLSVRLKDFCDSKQVPREDVHGLPTLQEAKRYKTQREAKAELEGIDTSNIVSSRKRKCTEFLPLPI